MMVTKTSQEGQSSLICSDHFHKDPAAIFRYRRTVTGTLRNLLRLPPIIVNLHRSTNGCGI